MQLNVFHLLNYHHIPIPISRNLTAYLQKMSHFSPTFNQNVLLVNPLRQFHQIIMVTFHLWEDRLISRVVEKKNLMFQIIVVMITVVIVRNKTLNIHSLKQ